jgi:hypothetical protein
VMVEALVATYEKGAITAHHLVVQCLHMIDPADPALILDALPDKILSRMLEFTRKYQSGRMVSSDGLLPADDQVEAARKWIEGASKVAPASSSKT